MVSSNNVIAAATAACRFCGCAKLLHIMIPCGQQCAVLWPDHLSPRIGPATPKAVGLDIGNSTGEYVSLRVCMACQRIQKDLFLPFPNKNNKKEWTLFDKLEDCNKRLVEVGFAMAEAMTAEKRPFEHDLRNTLATLVENLQAVDRCMPPLIKYVERMPKKTRQLTILPTGEAGQGR